MPPRPAPDDAPLRAVLAEALLLALHEQKAGLAELGLLALSEQQREQVYDSVLAVLRACGYRVELHTARMSRRRRCLTRRYVQYQRWPPPGIY